VRYRIGTFVVRCGLRIALGPNAGRSLDLKKLRTLPATDLAERVGALADELDAENGRDNVRGMGSSFNLRRGIELRLRALLDQPTEGPPTAEPDVRDQMQEYLR
jgi:hypothetical protein